MTFHMSVAAGRRHPVKSKKNSSVTNVECRLIRRRRIELRNSYDSIFQKDRSDTRRKRLRCASDIHSASGGSIVIHHSSFHVGWALPTVNRRDRWNLGSNALTCGIFSAKMSWHMANFR